MPKSSRTMRTPRSRRRCRRPRVSSLPSSSAHSADSELQPMRLQPRCAQGTLYDVDDLVAPQLQRGQIDRNLGIALPRGHVAAGALEAPGAEPTDEVEALRERNELRRRDGAAGHAVPAQQCLLPDDPARREVTQRHVDDAEFVLGKRALEIVLELQPVVQLRLHVGREREVAAASPVLGAIERKVGALDQRLDVGLRAARHHRPDRDTDADSVAAQCVGLADVVYEALGNDRDACSDLDAGPWKVMANSSPPRRAMRSLSRRHRRRRPLTASRSASPERCPSQLSTSLKWSRSRDISTRLW